MPTAIPVVVLGCLAINKEQQGRGVGRPSLQDAGKRALYATEAIEIRGMVLQPMSDSVKAFYVALGLEPSPVDPMILTGTKTDLQAPVSGQVSLRTRSTGSVGTAPKT
jgi:hypothetical protein